MTGYNLYLNTDGFDEQGSPFDGDPLFLGLSFSASAEANAAVQKLESTGLYSKGSIFVDVATAYRSLTE